MAEDDERELIDDDGHEGTRGTFQESGLAFVSGGDNNVNMENTDLLR